jgi:hypothetical protein
VQCVARGEDAGPRGRLGLGPAFGENVGCALEGVPSLDDGDAAGQVGGRADLDRESEAVQQLGPQLALLRVAAADEHEARRVAHRQAVALHHVLAAGGDVQQEIHQVVLQQVHLVDVEEAAMGTRQQTRLEGLAPLRQCALQVECPDQAVLRGAEGEVHHRHRRQHARRPGGAAGAAISAGWPGSQLKRQPAMAGIGGRRAASARIAVDLPVPRSPSASTPPMRGSTAQSSRESLSSSCATMALNGNTRRGAALFRTAALRRGLLATKPSMLRRPAAG